MRTVAFVAVGLAVTAGLGAVAQPVVLERLDRGLLDAAAPSERVNGDVGALTVEERACRTDVADADIRRRIVNIAAQEWGYFGFSVVDETEPDMDIPTWDFTLQSADQLVALLQAGALEARRFPRRWPRPDAAELRRTAASVAGFWAVTPEGGWIVANQNDIWSGPDAWSETGRSPRWRDPWSAAFISWVMCEAGLGTTDRFQRAVAHRVYVDQAIRAGDGAVAAAAFVARDLGEVAIGPGDLLCSSRSPVYRSIAERRRHMGQGARSHCDIAVAIDGEKQLILAIGGNVRGTVSLKILPAVRSPGGSLRPSPIADDERHIMFAHLVLQAEPIEANALVYSPTVWVVACQAAVPAPQQLAGVGLFDIDGAC